ncbi:glycoside hydrolase family 66 protein [uncultured Draconibacterium sp.]|uniref:glycoside hydrolase family 66 protein n=1 Tax=uncultured Draconibacterium sp. TaxID=1573823 RepID=UPI0029C7C961|nr:glycoside hydrolase family 66 protein [uncultured Draconibacterium sp.]
MKELNKILINITLAVLVMACSKSKDEITPDPEPEIPVNVVTPAYSNMSLVTDKAAYLPGSTVTFTIDESGLPASVKVRYKYLNNVIDEGTVSGISWKWQAPDSDFKGYTVEVYDDNGSTETIYATVGVDVSSDWTKFPRYGFLSKYPQLTDAEMDEVVDNLNKYHINGLQFYDWMNKHHMPLPVVDGTPAGSWKDIINRNIYFSTVEKYISKAHDRNMKTMFYNLVYGAWDNAEADGIQKEWYVYTDDTHVNRDFHPLSSPFLSNIFLIDPSNSAWQQYIALENQKVYEHLNFDGYHMDQLGDRGTRYKYDGSDLNLSLTYQPFIEAMKADEPSKNIAMNAVNQYGQQGIAQSSADFLYTEVWSPYDTYNDLSFIIQQNNTYGNNAKNTILAAYMNYDLANNQGYFNTPAVLMTDAVIFAFGGAHLELGEHMLGKEYFPNSNLQMKADLKSSLPDYYDFLVAYQNLLRDGGSFNVTTVTSVDNKMNIAPWPASIGAVATVCKKVGNNQVVHLINFTDSRSQQWRDNEGTQAIPALIKDAPVSIATNQTVKKVWVASPDIIGGASRSLEFSQSGNEVVFTLPELKYWTMVVLEY